MSSSELQRGCAQIDAISLRNHSQAVASVDLVGQRLLCVQNAPPPRDEPRIVGAADHDMRTSLDTSGEGDRWLLGVRPFVLCWYRQAAPFLAGAIVDGTNPEALKVEAIRTNGKSTVPGGEFLP